MTEEEARTKVCCGAPQNAAAAAWAENHPAASLPALCLGSACMAWRWDWTPEQAARVTVFPQSPAQGHCGLAGAERQ